MVGRESMIPHVKGDVESMTPSITGGLESMTSPPHKTAMPFPSWHVMKLPNSDLGEDKIKSDESEIITRGG